MNNAEFVRLPFPEYRRLAEKSGNKAALAEIAEHLKSGAKPKFAIIPASRHRRLMESVGGGK